MHQKIKVSSLDSIQGRPIDCFDFRTSRSKSKTMIPHDQNANLTFVYESDTKQDILSHLATDHTPH